MPTRTFRNLAVEKQEKILQAAIREFKQRNVQEANLSNIVSAAGISRGSLYQYFSNREDMYVYIFDTLRARRAEYVKPAFNLYKKAPFIEFFEAFYLRDSEFLLMHPDHIELGKQLYSHAHGVSRGLIQRQQIQYKESFLIAIEFDKERNIIAPDIDSSALAELCVHFVTDIFIFHSVTSQLSMENIRRHASKTLYIIKNGITLRNAFPLDNQSSRQ
ncbi:MAG: TetR/AcrR family transcriptional regulator [Synergistaceae bacterium]|jgi:AcrR family transcriptional regulator|nr:TetR/AcrR family transcriptional regulator [Synergistaceae bacterium]